MNAKIALVTVTFILFGIFGQVLGGPLKGLPTPAKKDDSAAAVPFAPPTKGIAGSISRVVQDAPAVENTPVRPQQDTSNPVPSADPRISSGDTLIQQVQRSILVDLSAQKIYVLDRGEKIYESNISSGKLGFETPTGDTQVIHKEESHWSNQYKCWMPWALELGFTDKGVPRGIHIHEGFVHRNNYPASHACVRVPAGAAKKIYDLCPTLTPVKIRGTILDFLQKNFAGFNLLEIRDGEVYFKLNKDGSLPSEFIRAYQSRLIPLCRLNKKGTEITSDKSQWTLGWPFMKRSNQIPVSRYDEQTGDSIRTLRPGE